MWGKQKTKHLNENNQVKTPETILRQDLLVNACAIKSDEIIQSFTVYRNDSCRKKKTLASLKFKKI